MALAPIATVWLATGLFLAGMMAGAGAALLWLRHFYRTRPLLLIDPGHADMPMRDAVRHVARHGGGGIRTREDAALALLEEASGGRLSLWRPASPLLFRRLTPRQVRRARAVLGLRRADEIPGARFVRDEVERRWPVRVARILTDVPFAAEKWPSTLLR